MKTSQKFVSFAVASSLLLFTVACGKGVTHYVTGVQVKSYEKDNDVFAEATLQLDLGNISLPSGSIPVMDPHDAGKTYGTVALRNSLDGKPEIDLTIDVTAVSHGQIEDSRFLPNGTAIPVGGLQNVAVAGLKAGSSSRVYVAAGSGFTMLGLALVIPKLDQITSVIPGNVNFFPSFKIGKINGMAGIFTSTEAHQSGLALFLDVGAASVPIATKSGILSLSTLSRENVSESVLTFPDVIPDAESKGALEYGMFRLHRKRAHLSVE